MYNNKIDLFSFFLKNLWFEIDTVNYIDDDKVNECIMYMYLYFICDASQKEDLFQKFSKYYNELDDKQKELVKQDYLKVIENKDAKVKKKG